MVERIGPTCASAECARKPTHYLQLRIPAKGYGMDRAMTCIAGLALCRDHAEEQAQDLAPFREMLTAPTQDITRSLGLAVPDLDRMEAEVRRIGDDAWQSLLEERARGEGGGRA